MPSSSATTVKISLLLLVSCMRYTTPRYWNGHIKCSHADLQDVLQREVGQLSGGELQRFAIGVVCVQQADMYVSLPTSLPCLFSVY